MDGWQTGNSNSKPKSKRAFVGNLSPNPNLEAKLRELFSNSNITTHKIDIIKPKVGSNCFALVQCDVEEAIKCLNGIPFQGNSIIVQKEKKQVNGSRNNGRRNVGMTKFGGGWAKPTQSNFKQNGQGNDNSNNNKNNKFSQSKGLNEKNDVTKTKVAAVDKSTLIEDAFNHEKSNQVKSTASSPNDDVSSFHSRCKVNLSKLMEEYGEYDPDFENMKITESSLTTPSSSNATNNTHNNREPDPQSINNNDIGGMLAPNGNAPIHIELVSFGFKYSVPPQARHGWSYSNPLSPIDCRNLPRCPHHVAKLSGLSFKVKKALLSNYYGAIEDNDENVSEEIGEQVINENDKDIAKKNDNSSNPLMMQKDEVTETIIKAIEDAINIGQHGYAFPLQASIHIGSEYGRHRSVVLCESVAQHIRKLLRKNEGGRITTPVSVGVRHRDVDKDHKDEEAFGNDLRRIHDAEVKRKKKQEWLESRNDNKW
jgi:hypothetical protein